jgi:hypothetical protein
MHQQSDGPLGRMLSYMEALLIARLVLGRWNLLIAGRSATPSGHHPLDQAVLLGKQPPVRVVSDNVHLVDHGYPDSSPIWQAKAPAKDLLGKRLGCERAQGDDDTDILDVPAFFQLVDAYSCANRTAND